MEQTKSSESEQRKAEQILLECFHKQDETFLSALVKIKEQMPISRRRRAILEATWLAWELYGGPND